MKLITTVILAATLFASANAAPNSLAGGSERRGVSVSTDVCFRACFAETPRCPEGWHPKREGECWTCCKEEVIDV
jgi:hypothetical protein